jgi:acyl-CoA-binding protein
MPAPIQPAFSSQQSTLDTQDTSNTLSTNMRSPQLYALYKQATQDPPIDKAENPGTFDFKVSQGTLLNKRYSSYQEHGS